MCCANFLVADRKSHAKSDPIALDCNGECRTRFSYGRRGRRLELLKEF